VLFVYQRAFTPELIIHRPVRIRVGSREFLHHCGQAAKTLPMIGTSKAGVIGRHCVDAGEYKRTLVLSSGISDELPIPSDNQPQLNCSVFPPALGEKQNAD
jgi:hypothetical protein